MSINRINSGSNPIDKLTKPQGSSKSASTGATEKPSSEGAVTTLSGQSSALSAAGAPFNAEKVAEIKEAISNGEFKVNAEAVAAKVIESARELLGQK
ncbi:flagellar biosynthesis anti-sigma factor FlgM [Limnobacter sp.]|uniref:flagellar biosynthesis anti-sigma factor FlgM n=1 Tax=Limnobacter sp. TaxID=2003368 RepID=UPI002FE061D8